MKRNATRKSWMVTVVLLTVVAATPAQQEKKSQPKPRVVITADPELDDNNTLIRAILYSSDYKIEGLVYVSSQFHWTGDGKEKDGVARPGPGGVLVCSLHLSDTPSGY